MKNHPTILLPQVLEYSILTFNTNNKDISKIIPLFSDHLSAHTLIINLQEAFNYVNNSAPLITALKNTFHNHTIICKEQLCGVLTIILSKSPDKDIKVLKLGLSIFYLPIKGFIAIKYNNIIFINCHLKPHANNNHIRMKMIDSMFRSVKTYFKEFAGIVLAGDLNFRITHNEITEKLLYERDFEKLREFDEGLEFLQKYNFKEGTIRFNPTFKIDNFKYNLKRFPGWCDRIFYGFNSYVEINEYKCVDTVCSDHIPVVSRIKVVIGDDKYRLKCKSDCNLVRKVLLGSIYSKIYQYCAG